MKYFKDLVLIILGILIWVYFLFPYILTPFYIPLTLIRWTVNFLAKIYRPDLVLISRMDSFLVFKRSDQNPLVNPTQVWKLKGKLNVENFREHFHKCFLSTKEDREKYRNLYCYFVEYFGYIFKKRVEPWELDLDKHIREVQLEELVKDEEIRNGYLDFDTVVDTFIGKWMVKNTFERGRPSWEILVVQPRKEDKGEKGSVLCFKIDHGLSDGYSFVHIVDKLTGVKSPYLFPDKKFSNWVKAKYILQGPALCLWIWLRLGFQREILHRIYPRKLSDRKWFVSFATLDLDLVKTIRRKTQTHFVSIMMSIQTGALRRMMLYNGKVKSVQDLSKTMTITHSLGWPQHPAMTGKGLANNLTVSAFNIPLQEENPLERLLSTEDEFNSFEQFGYPQIINWLIFSVSWIHPGWLNRTFSRVILDFIKVPHLFSSLMCSSEEHTLMGLPVKNLYLPLVGLTMLPNLNMYAISTTHSNQLDLSINASTAIFKNKNQLDIFTQIYMPEELERLADACGVQHFSRKIINEE